MTDPLTPVRLGGGWQRGVEAQQCRPVRTWGVQ